MDTDEAQIKQTFYSLYSIVKKLRSKDGCAWDREQTPYSLRANLLEETYECIDAIERNDSENLQEELGDLFLLITMIASIAEETTAVPTPKQSVQHSVRRSFRLVDVLKGICRKLIRRHPHVFSDARTENTKTVKELVAQWNSIKQNIEGKNAKNTVFDTIPQSTPPLDRAYQIQKKAAKVNFDWPSITPVWEKLNEEIRELQEACAKGNRKLTEMELGDLLFTVVNLARFLDVNPSLALNSTNQKFVRRFQAIEKHLATAGMDPAETGLEIMDAIWDKIKADEYKETD